MKRHYDKEADALYLRLDDSAIIDSEEIRTGIILDYNAQDEVVGIEILRVQARVPEADLRRVLVEVAVYGRPAA